ncbi:MAG: methylmalonyl Co-A mutase-associated GTPase MeaB [Pirellulaceae bacterium]
MQQDTPPPAPSGPPPPGGGSAKRRALSVNDFESGVRAGDVTILARALTLIESNHPRHQQQAEQLLTRLLPFTGRAIRVGITGAPGAGKSTFIEALGLYLVRNGRRLAVLAVDPSSGISGGSILGDKTRMGGLAAEPSAYIRPSPSAGTLGGVARKTRETMLVCEAAGYDVVLIETVGVGQSETMVADITDCFLALLLPGAGDELQGIKRGLLELVDVIAVNKADGAMRVAAEVAARQFSLALQSLAGRTASDAPPVLTCSALQHTGIDVVWQAVENRFRTRQAQGTLVTRRQAQNLRWLWTIVEDRLREAVHTHPAVAAIRTATEQAVLDGTLPPEAAARRILHAFESGEQP